MPIINNEYSFEIKIVSGVSNFVGRISRALRDETQNSDSGGEQCSGNYGYAGQLCQKWAHAYSAKRYP